MITDSNGQRLLTGYVPKVGLSYTALVLFGLLAVAYWFYLFRHGKKYMLTLCISMTCMMAGCGIRIKMTDQPGNLGIYIASTFFTLLSPCGFIANNYIILPRLATWLDAEDCLFLSSRKIVRIFVWSDVITFWLQGGGSGLTASSSSSMITIGKWVCLVGLIIQFISYAVYCTLLLVFGHRVRKEHPWKWSRSVASQHGIVNLRFREDWRALYYALIWASCGIIVRSIFRIAEYAQGYDGYLRTHEAFLYLLDSLPLFLAMLAWALLWPPTILRDDDKPFSGAHAGVGGYRLTALGDKPESPFGSA